MHPSPHIKVAQSEPRKIPLDLSDSDLRAPSSGYDIFNSTTNSYQYTELTIIHLCRFSLNYSAPSSDSKDNRTECPD